MWNVKTLARIFAAGSLLLFASTGKVQAALITDPAGDILPSFVGTPGGDLDVLNAEVFYDGTNFIFRSQENGNIGTTSGALFVWGIDRGTHNPRFGAFQPGVLFDAVVTLLPNQTGTVTTLGPGAPVATPLAAGSVTINGSILQAIVPASLLPSTGVDPSQYGVNLWPRVGTGNNNQIADFAPNNSVALVTVTPEPSSILLTASAILALALNRKRK